MDVLVFVVMFVVALGSSLAMLFARSAVHVALFLVATQVALAVAFLLQGAFFVAAVQVIVYAGAIMVLFIFVIMMLNLGETAVDQERRWLSPKMWVGPAILSAILLIDLTYMLSQGTRGLTGNEVDPKQVGIDLFGPYLLAVELAAMLLLAALVGAYHLGRREPEEEG